jgi:hypothetical protein
MKDITNIIVEKGFRAATTEHRKWNVHILEQTIIELNNGGPYNPTNYRVDYDLLNRSIEQEPGGQWASGQLRYNLRKVCERLNNPTHPD